MDIIKLAQIYDELGNFVDSDRLDNILIKLSKSETGKDLIEGVEWKNPDFSPQELQRMEREIYPSGFHTYDDYDASELQELVEYLPEEQRTLGNIKSMFEEALSDETDKVIVDGEPNQFYFVLEVDDDEKMIEAADMTVAIENRRTNFLQALHRIYQILKPYSDAGYFIYCDLRHSTSWPMMKTMVEKGWIEPDLRKKSPVKKVERDETGKLKIKTETHYLGGEKMHQFQGKLTLPSEFPYVQRLRNE